MSKRLKKPGPDFQSNIKLFGPSRPGQEFMYYKIYTVQLFGNITSKSI